MSNERWEEVRLLFFELAELGPEDRAVRLESLSKTDPELHAQGAPRTVQLRMALGIELV